VASKPETEASRCSLGRRLTVQVRLIQRQAFTGDPSSGIVLLGGRVGVWRGGFRLSMRVAAPFVWRCLSGSTVTPFPHAE